MRIASTVLAPALVSAAVSVASVSVEAAQTLSFDVKFHDTFIAVESGKLQVGDRIVIDDALFKDKQPTGRAVGLCTITSFDAMAICTVSVVLKDGVIATQFVGGPPANWHFAVVGGSGAYV